MADAEKQVDAEAACAQVAGLLLAYPAKDMEAEFADVKAEFYAVAIEDVPAWAVAAACRDWARGETQHQRETGKLGWAPSPDQIRAAALSAMWRLCGRHRVKLDQLLRAQPYDPPQRAEKPARADAAGSPKNAKG